jgi:hypothetical protein
MTPMRYYHRTSLAIDDVLGAVETFFGPRMQRAGGGGRHRVFTHAAGTVTVDVRPEGGHYTHVAVATDQPGESEVDKIAKQFLGVVHGKADPRHALRGAY